MKKSDFLANFTGGPWHQGVWNYNSESVPDAAGLSRIQSGELLADLATAKNTELPVQFMSLSKSESEGHRQVLAKLLDEVSQLSHNS